MATKKRTRKYGKKAAEKVAEAQRERKRGTLRSSSGAKVQSRQQAIAIGLNEARREGGKVPPRKGAKQSAAKRGKRRAPAGKARPGARKGRKK